MRLIGVILFCFLIAGCQSTSSENRYWGGVANIVGATPPSPDGYGCWRYHSGEWQHVWC